MKMARKPVAKSVGLDEMFDAFPEQCRNETVKEICGMFLESRNELGFPFTERALKIVVNKYDWTAEMLAASLLCAMERGWRGVFLPNGQMYNEYAEAYRRMLAKANGAAQAQKPPAEQMPPEYPPPPAWDANPPMPWIRTISAEERERFMEAAKNGCSPVVQPPADARRLE